jgi:hypothetical protein
MKYCPKCNREYSDPSLEFCLEDGVRLNPFLPTKRSEETVVLPPNAIQTNPASGPVTPTQNLHLENSKTNKVQVLKEKAVDRGYQILEVAPIVFALIHNYWQWLFADKQTTSSILDFLLSGSFIVWFILFIFTLGLSLSTLKFGRNRGFAVTGLIILAINLLLFIVPRK